MKETILQLLLDPYTQKNTDFNRTTQNVYTFSGQTSFPKQRTDN